MRRSTWTALVVALWVAWLGLASLGGCKRRSPGDHPDTAVRELVERLRRTGPDAADAKAASALLSKRARDNLAARAERYVAASGKPIGPEAMLVPARAALRFEPARYSVLKRTATSAIVEVRGLAPHEVALVPCVLEEGSWHVDIELPPLPPVQKRPGTKG